MARTLLFYTFIFLIYDLAVAKLPCFKYSGKKLECFVSGCEYYGSFLLGSVEFPKNDCHLSITKYIEVLDSYRDFLGVDFLPLNKSDPSSHHVQMKLKVPERLFREPQSHNVIKLLPTENWTRLQRNNYLKELYYRMKSMHITPHFIDQVEIPFEKIDKRWISLFIQNNLEFFESQFGKNFIVEDHLTPLRFQQLLEKSKSSIFASLRIEILSNIGSSFFCSILTLQYLLLKTREYVCMFYMNF